MRQMSKRFQQVHQQFIRRQLMRLQAPDSAQKGLKVGQMLANAFDRHAPLDGSTAVPIVLRKPGQLIGEEVQQGVRQALQVVSGPRRMAAAHVHGGVHGCAGVVGVARRRLEVGAVVEQLVGEPKVDEVQLGDVGTAVREE